MLNTNATEDRDQRAARERLSAGRDLLAAEAPPLREFYDALFATAAPEDILRSMPPALAALARSVFAVAARHTPGATEVRLIAGPDTAEPEQLVIAVNDDRPFLYDSALLAAIAGGARIRAAFHPVVAFGGQANKISVIALVVDALATDALRNHLLDGLTASFEQGKVAVRDWAEMLARLKQARDALAATPPRGTDVSEDLAFLDWVADNHFTFLGVRDYRLLPADHKDNGAHGRLDAVAGKRIGRLVRRRRAGDPQGRRATRPFRRGPRLS